MVRSIVRFVFAVACFLQWAHAVDLRVENAPAIFHDGSMHDVNGIYVPYTEQSGRPAWKHESKESYIYYGEYGGIYYWNIDNDLNIDPSLFYSEDDPDPSSPVNVKQWTDLDYNPQSAVTVSEILLVVVPEIHLKGNGVGIPDGNTTVSMSNHTDFGSVHVHSGTVSKEFLVQNLGTMPLDIHSITIDGAHASDFTVTAPPSSSIVQGNNSSFTVQLNPSAVGKRTATIHISNSDSDESPYDFAIEGYGFEPANIQVSGITDPVASNGVYVHQGVRNGYEYWKHETDEFYVQHAWANGMNFWIISNKLEGTYSDCLWSKVSSAVTPIGLSDWQSSLGYHSTGAPVVAAMEPVAQMRISGLNQSHILDNDITPRLWDGTHFGSVSVSEGARSRTFSIHNLGGESLDLTGVPFSISIQGDAASDFTVTAAPLSTVGVNESTSFSISFNPSAPGTRSAMVVIENTDANQNPYNFTIQGDGYEPRSLVVSGITGTPQANGKYILQGTQNEFQYWKHESASYYLYNDVVLYSRYWFIDSDLSRTEFLFRSGSWSEESSPVGIGDWTASTGNGGLVSIAWTQAEIALSGNTLNIIHGDAYPSTADHTDFGTIDVTGESVSRTYMVQNVGNDDLLLTGTPVVGITGSSAFTVSLAPATTLAPGESSFFDIIFDPATVGAHSATVQIANTDSDENPFVFSIQGTAKETPASVNFSSIISVDKFMVQLEGLLISEGSYPVTQHGFCWNTSGGPTVENGTCTQDGGAVTGEMFEGEVLGLAAGTTYAVRAYATTTAGTVYSTEQTFITPAHELTLSTYTESFDEAENYLELDVSANGAWRLSVDAPWVSFSPEIGFGNDRVFITIQGNETSVSRSATVSVLLDGDFEKTLLIQQEAHSPRAPEIISIETGLTIQEEESFTVSELNIEASDADGDLLTILLGTGPHYSLSGLVVTPEPDFFGTLKIPVWVSDGVLLSECDTLVLDVLPVNDLPEVRDTLLQGSGQFTLDLFLLSHDKEGAIASVEIVDPPLFGTAEVLGSTVVYTPSSGFFGKDSILWLALDENGMASSAATVVFHIFPTTATRVVQAHNRSLMRILKNHGATPMIEFVVKEGAPWDLRIENVAGVSQILAQGVGVGALQNTPLKSSTLGAGVHFIVLRVQGRVVHKIPFTGK